MIKWLEEITVAETESQNYYHFHDNRVLPSHVDEKLANEEGEPVQSLTALPGVVVVARAGLALARFVVWCAASVPWLGPAWRLVRLPSACADQCPLRTAPCTAPGWWYKPDFIINDLNVQSAIGYPAHEEVVPLAAGTYPVRGYAYCGALREGEGGREGGERSWLGVGRQQAALCRTRRGYLGGEEGVRVWGSPGAEDGVGSKHGSQLRASLPQPSHPRLAAF
jgi:hypothetical protein